MSWFDSETKIFYGIKLPFPFPSDSYIGEELLNAFDRTPDRILQINHDEQVTYTCRDIKLLTIRLAKNLIKFGIKSDDDIVGMVCRNSKHLLPIIYGSLVAGAPFNPLHVSFEKDEIVNLFAKTDPKIVFCDHDVYHVVKAALDELESEAEIFTTMKKVPGARFIEELLESTGDENEFVPQKFPQPPSKKIGAIMCSSGTTGPAKGCVVPQVVGLAMARDKGLPFPYKSFNFSPIYWGTGPLTLVMAVFHPNETIVSTLQPFNVAVLTEVVEKYKIDVVLLAPSQLVLFLNSKQAKTGNYSSIKAVATTGSIITDNMRQKFKEILPGRILNIFYGMTEVMISTMVAGESFDGLKVGKVLPNNEIRVIDADGNGLELGEVGEITVRSESLLLGYFKNEEATNASMTADGFFKTGDIGYIDEEGNVYLLDRKKFIFKCNGFHINPSEIENVICTIEGIELVSVVGIPDPVAVDIPAAVFVRKAGYDSVTEEQVVKTVSEKLPARKHLLGGAYLVDELPMTPSGKIQTKVVQEIALRRNHLGRDSCKTIQ